MTGVATYAVPPTFLGTSRRDRAAPICIAGIPLDLGTTNRSGARFGPGAIRQASRMLVDGEHPQHRVDATKLPLADIGDFAIALGDLAASIVLIEQQAQEIEHLIALGGDHSITLPLLRVLAKRRGPSGLVHFDAHVDTWPDSFGQSYGHGSVFYHAIEEGLIDPRRMVQIVIGLPRAAW
jgi:arginase family enzyme